MKRFTFQLKFSVSSLQYLATCHAGKTCYQHMAPKTKPVYQGPRYKKASCNTTPSNITRCSYKASACWVRNLSETPCGF